MHSNKLKNRIKSLLSRMYDTYYEVLVLTAHPGNIDYEEVLSIQNGHQLKLKHLAAYMAMQALESDAPIIYSYNCPSLNQVLQKFKADSKETVKELGETFSFFMDEVIRLN